MKKIILAAILTFIMGALLFQTKTENTQKPLFVMQQFPISFNLKNLASAD